MNPFTTDHPLAPQTSWFDRKEHPRLSFVCTTFLLSFILTPFWLICFYNWANSDVGSEPDPFPAPWWVFFGLLAFASSVFCALPIVAIVRYFTRCPGGKQSDKPLLRRWTGY